ncbi:MAG: FeoA domain-containing protein [Terrimicrobiaceae bacterium]|nr:FeoA domain-containing protein [Terrimicrobiaceae bacterium]
MSSSRPTQTLGDIHHKRLLEVVTIPGDCGRSGRLASLGLLPGVHLRVSRVAPLGDPISVEMDGQEISVRRAEANLIEVREVE